MRPSSWTPPLSKWSPSPWIRTWQAEGAGQTTDFSGNRPCRSIPAPARPPGAGRMMRRKKIGAGRINPGLSLTSRRRWRLAAARPLLLPPLLLTSTSLCRKVDLVPRQTLRASVVKGLWKSGTELLHKERGWRQGRGRTQRHGVLRAKDVWGRRLGGVRCPDKDYNSQNAAGTVGGPWQTHVPVGGLESVKRQCLACSERLSSKLVWNLNNLGANLWNDTVPIYTPGTSSLASLLLLLYTFYTFIENV